MTDVVQTAPASAAFWQPQTLAAHGDSPALLDGRSVLTYAELARRVEQEAQVWQRVVERRLVLVEIEATVASIVSYLAVLSAGHVVLLAAPESARRLAEAWEPDDWGARRAGQWELEPATRPARHELHPELALLMSTSGSTGSPKLVRLSGEAVRRNAADIAAALQLIAADRAVTTLPLHYCYGLSVLHSHLAVGGGVLLTDRSVVDPDLWTAMRAHRVTSLAGVPHTFELLEASAAPTHRVPSLRQVTQAGGRLEPGKVSQWAARGSREGWDLRVMYGQTEATARMAVTAPQHVRRDPTSAGSVIGAGRFTVRSGDRLLPPGEVGELHYEGPNVMLGYAESSADLARGRDVTELATGDLGVLGPDGAITITGRRSSFLKINGLRVDVEQAERVLSGQRLSTLIGGSDDGLLALVAGEQSAALVERATQALAAATGLPPHRIGVAVVPALPRLPTGKLDRGAVAATFRSRAGDLRGSGPTPAGASTAELVALYAELLGRPDADEHSTFVGLGGDSLSYVELSVQLEDRLGTLPDDWPQRPVRGLADTAAAPRRTWLARMDSTVVLRALAIVAIVGTHTQIFRILGGAHILLGVAGYNFARFAATAPTIRQTWRRVGGTVARIAVPTAIWTAIVAIVGGTYSAANVVLLNWVFGSSTWSSTWRLWFIEALVWVLLAFTALLSVPTVRRAYGRWPFQVAAAVAALGATARLDVFDLTSPPGRGTAPAVLWLVAIGWAAQVAASRRQRWLLSLIVVATLPGFMDNPVREATIAAGLLLVVWVRTLPVPRLVVPAICVLASASLYIYLTHFEVYRSTGWPLLNFALSIGIGLAAWVATSRLTPLATRALRRPISRTIQEALR